ncbi:MAG: hypothetical protein JNM81_14990 [Rhodospirillaceae bacterium]|nr:hypothetical protein [Rhodospirillaceae bacterium]
MIEIETITLYREKSTVHRFSAGGNPQADEPILEIRSNRVTIPIKTRVENVMVIVRGQNVPSTLRMTSLVIDEIRRDEGILHDAASHDWETFWVRKISNYESDYNPDNWVSIHIGGETVYATREGKQTVDVVEAIAQGGEITEEVIAKTAVQVLGSGIDLNDLNIEHDSQNAFVFQPFSSYHRAAILQRRDRKAGSFAISVYHPTPQKPVRLSHFISFCADLMEALTLKSFLARVQELIATNKISSSDISPSQVQATRNRRRDLVESIENFERANKLVYRPERPNIV